MSERFADYDAHYGSRCEDNADRLGDSDQWRCRICGRVVTRHEPKTCVHCTAPVVPGGHGDWYHAASNGSIGKSRCQSPEVAYGHLAHPAGVPCRAAGPNPCLGSVIPPAKP